MDQIGTKKVSIITCFLNVGSFLEEAIVSVINQTHTNWELWLIDDGSTDSSTGIAKKYAHQFPEKIHYYEHEEHRNLGASASRNIAIEKSTGEFIAFLDGDDLWKPNLLTGLLQQMERHSPALICEATEYWYNWDGSENKNIIIPVGSKQDYLFQPPQLMLDLYPLGTGAAPCICGMLIKKEILNKHGAFEASFKGMYDDQALLIKFYLHEKVYISSECNNLYRQRPGSLVDSSHKTGTYFLERKQFLYWLEKYIEEKNIGDERVKKILGKLIIPFRYPFYYFLVHKAPSKCEKFLKKLNKKVFRKSKK